MIGDNSLPRRPLGDIWCRAFWEAMFPKPSLEMLEHRREELKQALEHLAWAGRTRTWQYLEHQRELEER